MRALWISFTIVIAGLLAVPDSTLEPLLAGDTIRDATRMEHSPDFTDLYLIESEDRFRQIQVYCNVGGCYKLRGAVQSV
tara:strand:+ start:81 stop:317 length:237 start_codon:yes stop_codon:yes gene_type:complete